MAPPSDSRVRSSSDSQLGRVATGCALAVMVLGLAVMVGWLLGIEPLKRLLPQLTTMKFNAALGFLLAGAALYLREKPALRLGLAGAVGLLGALTLGQEVAGVDFGIDQLFVRAQVACLRLGIGEQQIERAILAVVEIDYPRSSTLADPRAKLCVSAMVMGRVSSTGMYVNDAQKATTQLPGSQD